MPGQCPYLGVEKGPLPGLPGPAAHNRCHAAGRPERVGLAYQAETCMAAAFRHCPRLASAAGLKPGERRARPAEAPGKMRPAARPAAPVGAATGRAASPKPPAAGPPPGRARATAAALPGAGSGWDALRPPAPRPALREARPAARDDTQPAGTATDIGRPGVPDRGGRARARRAGGDLSRPARAITATQVALMALGISAVFAVLSIALVLVYRLQMGPGMAAPPGALGTGAPPAFSSGRALRPTFTPTTQAAQPAPPATAAAPPTPVPLPTAGPPGTPVAGRLPADGPPTRLVIPKIGLDAPVVPVGVKVVGSGNRARAVWADAPNAGGFHETSAYPGRPGNTVINGHRDILGAIFRHLDRLEPGDEIVLYVGEVAYPYQVVETMVVPDAFASRAQRAENLRLIGPMPEERLTLVTCTPVGLATHRLLVIARPPAAGPTATP